MRHFIELALFATFCWAPIGALADAKTEFIAADDYNLPQKAQAEAVEVLEAPPTRDHVVLGAWRAAGDSHTSADQLVALGRQKAAELGADYLFLKKQDSITRHSVGPTGPFGMRMQSGMSVSSVATLRAEIGFFAKGTLGVVYENRGPRSTKRVVKGFTAGSKAAEAGILVGDEILEIDGLWANDRRDMAKFMLANSPGQIVTVVFRRNEQRQELKVPLVENR